MKLHKFVLPPVLVAAIGISGCEREKAARSLRSLPQVVVATVEPRDVPIVDEWIGTLDGSANVDIRARQARCERYRQRSQKNKSHLLAASLRQPCPCPKRRSDRYALRLAPI